MTRNKKLLLLLAMAVWGLTVRASSGKAPDLWATGLRDDSEPQVVTSARMASPASEDFILWQDGRAMVAVRKGEIPPGSLPSGKEVRVEVTMDGGKSLSGFPLEFRPVDWPNLPGPLGRLKTGPDGVGRLRLLGNQPVLLWAEDPGFYPDPVLVTPDNDHVRFTARPSPKGSFRVRDGSGRDVAGAVAIFLPTSAPSDPIALARGRREVARNKAGDAQGFLALPPPAMGGGVLVYARKYKLRQLGQAPERGVVVLDRAVPLQIRLEGALRTLPASWKAHLCFYHQGLPWLPVVLDWEFQGRFGEVYPPGYPSTLEVNARGYVSEKRLLAAPSSDTLVFHLGKGIVLSGAVRDEQGRPLSGARLSLNGWRAVPYWTSDETGIFATDPQVAGDAPWTLHVEAAGHLSRAVEVASAAMAKNLTVVLKRGGGIVGRVEDEETKEAPEDLGVRIAALRGRSSQGASFDAEVLPGGRFEALGLEEGSYRLEAFSKGRKSSPLTADVQDSLETDIGTLVMSRKPTVSGRLLSKEGESVDAQGAEVRLRCERGPREAAEGSKTEIEVDERQEGGAFFFYGVPRGTYRLEARVGDLSGRGKSFRVEEEDVSLGDVRLDKEASLRGRLLARGPTDFSGFRIILQSGVLDYDGPSATADSDGGFALDALPPGNYTLAVFAPLSVIPKVRRQIMVAAGEQNKEILVPVDGVDVGVFAQLDGKPATGALVAVQGAHDEAEGTPLAINSPEGMLVLGFPAPISTAVTDGGGYCVLQSAPPGNGTAVLSWEGGKWSLPVMVPSAPDGPLVWNFRGIVVHGRVEDSGGQPASGVRLAWEYPGRGAVGGNTAVTDGEGRFAFTGLAPGNLLVRASSPGRGSAETSVLLAEDGSPPLVVLRLEAGQ